MTRLTWSYGDNANVQVVCLCRAFPWFQDSKGVFNRTSVIVKWWEEFGFFTGWIRQWMGLDMNGVVWRWMMLLSSSESSTLSWSRPDSSWLSLFWDVACWICCCPILCSCALLSNPFMMFRQWCDIIWKRLPPSCRKGCVSFPLSWFDVHLDRRSTIQLTLWWYSSQMLWSSRHDIKKKSSLKLKICGHNSVFLCKFFGARMIISLCPNQYFVFYNTVNCAHKLVVWI